MDISIRCWGGVVGLMKYDEVTDTLKWVVNPTSESFDLKSLPLVKYVGWLKKDLDPQRNGNVYGGRRSL